MKVFDAMAQAFLDEKITTVFSLMGDANMFWLSSLLRRGVGIRNVHVRHENAAVAMADGFARTTSEVGVVTVTSGPGLTQTATALMGAARYRVPMVIFAGDTAVGDAESTQRVDHATFAALCGVHLETVTSSDDCLDKVQAAFYRATARSEPVMLSVPMDIQELEFAGEYTYVPSASLLARETLPVPREEEMENAAGLIISSRRPVVIIGEGVVRGNATEAVLAFGDKIGALFATSLLAKGAADESPWSVGIAGTFASPPCIDLMGSADLVIGVGASLNDYTSVGGHLYPNARVIQILDRPASVATPRRPVDCYLQGDAVETVQALSDLMSEAGHLGGQGFRHRLDALVDDPGPRDRVASREGREDAIDPRDAVAVLDQHIPDGAIVVCGAGHFWSFVIKGLVSGKGRRYLFTLGFGSIGQALPVAIGAAVGNPDTPVVVVEGDSSILMHPQELDTAVRQGLSILALILDDDGMGAEVHKLTERGFSPEPAIVATPDLPLMAKSFGAAGTMVRSNGELRSSLSSYDWSSVNLLDVKISRDVVDLDGVKGAWQSRSG